MSIELERLSQKKIRIKYTYKLMKLQNKHTTTEGIPKNYLNFRVIFPNSLKHFICPNTNTIFFYKTNKEQICITSKNPGSMYEYEKVNVVEQNPNTFAIVLPKYLFENLSNYDKFIYYFYPDQQEFTTGQYGEIIVEPA